MRQGGWKVKAGAVEDEEREERGAEVRICRRD
jgi:hypothetical protein